MSTIINNSAPDDPALTTAREAKALVDRIINSSDDASFSAHAVLGVYPELEQYRTCVIDLAYEEFFRRKEAGEDVAPSGFTQKFPEVQQSLFKVIELDYVLRENPELVQTVPEERWPKAGSHFCNCCLEEEIGRGALSRVFVARQTQLGMRQVILKVCVRGQREAELLGQLEHEGIVPVHSIHTDYATDLTAICMPYLTRVTMLGVIEMLSTSDSDSLDTSLSGRDVQEAIRKLNYLGGFEPSEVQAGGRPADSGVFRPDDEFSSLILKWGIQLASALAYAHEKNVLHCDVKPGNVLLLPDLSASLLDFNLAAADGETTRWAGGTFPYMASEQLRHVIESYQPDRCPEKLPAISEATDVFGLCATLWHIVTGEPPFGVADESHSRTQTDTASVMLQRQKRGVSADRISAAEEVLPKHIVSLLLQGLSYSAEDRPTNTTEIASAFQACLPAEKITPAARTLPAWLMIPATLVLVALLAMAALRPPAESFDTGQPAPAQQDAMPPEIRQAISDCQDLISRGEFAEAAGVVSTHKNTDSRCCFLELYCRTCALPAPEGRYVDRTIAISVVPGSEKDEEAARRERDRISELWASVADEWMALIEHDSSWGGPGWFNLSFVQLERADFRGAALAHQKALDLSFEAPATGRMDAVVRALYPSSDVETQNQARRQLFNNVVGSGSRGELLALTCATADLLKEPPDRVTDQEKCEAVADLLTILEGPALAEPSVVLLLGRARNHISDKSLLNRLMRSRKRDDQGPYNRLSTILELPDF